MVLVLQFRFEWLKSQGRPWFADLIGTWPAEGVDFLDKDPPFVSAGGGSARCERCSFKADLDPFCEEISCFSPACVSKGAWFGLANHTDC